MEQKTFLQLSLDKFNNCCPISDKELEVLLDHYTQLERLLNIHESFERYHLVWRDVYDKLERLKGWKVARNKAEK